MRGGTREPSGNPWGFGLLVGRADQVWGAVVDSFDYGPPIGITVASARRQEGMAGSKRPLPASKLNESWINRLIGLIPDRPVPTPAAAAISTRRNSARERFFSFLVKR